MSNDSRSTQRPTLAEWYQDRFRSDPFAVVEHFLSDICQVADQFGIDFNATLPAIAFGGAEQKLTSTRDGLVFSDSGSNGRSALWARVEQSREGVRYPHLTFNTLKVGGFSEAWSGFGALRALYEREADIPVDPERQRIRAAKIDAEKAERAAKYAQQEAKRARRAKAAAESVARDIAAWDTFEPFRSHAYADRKRITDAMGAAGARQGQDENGNFIALLLHDIFLRPRGLQRIYEQKIKTKKGSTDKLQTWEMDKKGSHLIIGDMPKALEEGARVWFAEGFATGATVFLATGETVVVAVDAGNLKHVVNAYCDIYPDMPKTIAADNDCWTADAGRGNAGMLAALELVKQHSSVKAVYPRFDDHSMDLEQQPTDWNDVHCIHQRGLEAVTKGLRAPACRLKVASNLFEYQLQRLSYLGGNRVDKFAMQALSAGMNLVPSQHTPKEVVTAIMDAVHPSVKLKGNGQQLRERARWIFRKKLKAARSLRAFSQETLEKSNVRYHKVSVVRHPNGHQMLGPDALRLIRMLRGPVILRGSIALGKTSSIMKPLTAESKDKSVFLAHRVSLVTDGCNTLTDKKQGVEVFSYQDLDAYQVPLIDHMGLCANSITHPMYAPHLDQVRQTNIDEVSQVLRQIASGKIISNPVAVMTRLGEVMRQSGRVLMCDADANDDVVKFVEQEMPGQTIHIIEAQADHSHLEVLHTSRSMAEQYALDSAKAGKRVFVATDGSKNLNTLAETVSRECPALKVLAINADSKADPDVEAFIANPNEECARWDVVIYSPTISSGFSITTKHFDTHVGVFFGVVVPSDVIQMIRRDRRAEKFVLGFEPNSGHRETEDARIREGLNLADRVVSEAFVDGRIVFQCAPLPFDEIRLATLQTERKGRNDYINTTLLMLIDEGYQVGRMERNALKEEEANANRKESKVRVEKAEIELTLEVETPSDDRADYLSRQDVISRADRASLTRYTIEKQLCVEVEEESIKFLKDRGLDHVVRFETLQADEERCRQFDSHLVNKGVVLTRRKHKTAQHQLLRKLFNALGLDFRTGEGSFGSQEAQAAVDAILTNEGATAMYNELGLGSYVTPGTKPACATTFVKNMLAKLGLTTKRKRDGRARLSRQYIDPDTWARIATYCDRRQACGVSSLAVHSQLETGPSRPPQPVETPLQAASYGAGGCSSEGGATFSDSNITVEAKLLTSETTPVLDYAVALEGVDTGQLSDALWSLAVKEELAIAQEPEPGQVDRRPCLKDPSMRLMVLVLEVQDLLRRRPWVLEEHPELAWIDWKAGVAA